MAYAVLTPRARLGILRLVLARLLVARGHGVDGLEDEEAPPHLRGDRMSDAPTPSTTRRRGDPVDEGNETRHRTCKHVRKPCVNNQKAGTHFGIWCIAASLLNSK